jgi:hypothetical protein
MVQSSETVVAIKIDFPSAEAIKEAMPDLPDPDLLASVFPANNRIGLILLRRLIAQRLGENLTKGEGVQYGELNHGCLIFEVNDRVAALEAIRAELKASGLWTNATIGYFCNAELVWRVAYKTTNVPFDPHAGERADFDQLKTLQERGNRAMEFCRKFFDWRKS